MSKKENSQKAGAPLSLYAAFDTFPAPKGAAIHIREFSQSLFELLPPGLLLALGNQELPAWQIEPDRQIRRLVSTEPNFLKRTLEFQSFVADQLAVIGKTLKIAHFRDPWSGLPIVTFPGRKFKTVFEINALPSIELPARYPGLGHETLQKIRTLEIKCIEGADLLLCPSQTIRSFLENELKTTKPIKVIANGSDLPAQIPEKPENAPGDYLIYLGAVQPWQGIEVLFKALQFLADFDELKLVMCASGSKPRLKYLVKLAQHLGVSEKIIWNINLRQSEVHKWLAHAKISLAPLTECARNLIQGCCPIKIIESMAFAVPVIASDIPVVRELLNHNENGRLVRPDRPAELARSIRILLSHPQEAAKLGVAGREKVNHQLTWEHSRDKLRQAYSELGV